MENECSHTPIALAVFGTKIIRHGTRSAITESCIGVGGLWGGRDWAEMALFGCLAKGDDFPPCMQVSLFNLFCFLH